MAAAAVGTIIASILTQEAVEQLKKNLDHLKNSCETYLEFRNFTDGAIQIKIDGNEVDNHDWDGESRPELFNDKIIEAGESFKLRQEINAKSSSAMSTMAILQDGNEQFKMRINQWDAKSDEQKNFDFPNNYSAQFSGQNDTLTITITKKC